MISKKTNWPVTILLILGAVFILFPLYLTVTIAFKTPQELAGNLLALPQNWSLSNFAQAIEMTNFFNALKNSVFVTVLVVIFTVLTNSMVAYAIARNMHKKFYKFTFYYFVSAMFIPFPIIMLPIVRQTALWNMDNLIGLVILYIVYNLSFNIFIYVGYIRSIPKELEEAAIVDGASTWGVFWKVIFPLLAPMNATVAILTCLGAWNDFLLPLVVLSDSDMATLPLVQYIFQSQFSTDYNLAFASYLLALVPMILVYVFAQKWIISGVMKGSIK
ncbi:carbohydrate ABC transporter permease [Metabacillus indicus]|jgi:raffinose/stachyose/melibiose transport system permease protein|uniref:ABC transporter permease n=1 Tax=Metabacillus indicus TaxID=246786 RepID=A0A084GIP4_METID|nr:carbohydrate ABC transporter permease [Metabacillus indicus]KEZ47206.1 ABC transporter permease [Metabacillus indicus]KEZ49799.1 ABC transporter permease [Metabacillus indicus LMG 22858]MDX8291191.1 carbohydrate ABC transporter permease [Metabacillus indicus]